MPGWSYMWGPGWVGGLLMLAAMILFTGGLITAAILLARGVNRFRSTEDSALRILDERFARGEIDDEEYQRRRATLSSSAERSAR